MKQITLRKAIEIFEGAGRISPEHILSTEPDVITFNIENEQAMFVALSSMRKLEKVEELIQELGIQQPVLTAKELSLYKRLKEICDI